MRSFLRSGTTHLLLMFSFLLTPTAVWAHGIVGDRMFIEPLNAEDANVKNELVLPRAEFLTLPDGSFRTFNASFEKSLYPDRWSVVLEQEVRDLRAESLSVSADLGGVSRQSEIQEMVKERGLGLEELHDPPYRIVVHE